MNRAPVVSFSQLGPQLAGEGNLSSYSKDINTIKISKTCCATALLWTPLGQLD